MKRHHEITTELKGLNVSFPEDMEEPIFSLPDGYFEQLAESLLTIVQTEQVAATFPDALPFDLPENYFEQFPDKVLQGLMTVSADDEISTLSPLLAGLREKMPFEVPTESYFNQKNIPTRTIAMPALVPKVKWMRWAAAAAVLCIFSLGGFRFLQTPTADANPSIQAALASIPDADIQQYLSLNMDAYDFYSLSDGRSNTATEEELLNEISDTEIESILENGY